MTDKQDREPRLPIRRTLGMLDGIITCADCGELLISVTDADGNPWYVHEWLLVESHGKHCRHGKKNADDITI